MLRTEQISVPVAESDLHYSLARIARSLAANVSLAESEQQSPRLFVRRFQRRKMLSMLA